MGNAKKVRLVVKAVENYMDKGLVKLWPPSMRPEVRIFARRGQSIAPERLGSTAPAQPFPRHASDGVRRRKQRSLARDGSDRQGQWSWRAGVPSVRREAGLLPRARRSDRLH